MKFLSYLLSLGSCCLFSMYVHSQAPGRVGINTAVPRTTLEVAGDMKVEGDFSIQTINKTNGIDEGTFLIQNNTNFVKDLHAGDGGFAIAYFQEYELKNMVGDWVEYLDTGIPSSDYVVTITSAYFNQELTMDGTASSNFTIPYASAYVHGGFWRIRADYPSASKKGNSEGVWVITTMILSKAFSKQFTPLPYNVYQSTSGAAGSAIIN